MNNHQPLRGRLLAENQRNSDEMREGDDGKDQLVLLAVQAHAPSKKAFVLSQPATDTIFANAELVSHVFKSS